MQALVVSAACLDQLETPQKLIEVVDPFFCIHLTIVSCASAMRCMHSQHSKVFLTIIHLTWGMKCFPLVVNVFTGGT